MTGLYLRLAARYVRPRKAKHTPTVTLAIRLGRVWRWCRRLFTGIGTDSTLTKATRTIAKDGK